METRGLGTVRLRVHIVDTAQRGGEHVQRNEVFCPRRRQSVEMATCCACPRVVAVAATDDCGIEVSCAPASAPEEQSLVGASVSTQPSRAVRGDVTLQEIASLFTHDGPMRIAVVDEGGRLTGVVEERDMCSEYMVHLRDVTSLEAQALARAPFRVTETTTVRDALRAMAAHRLRSIPVVTDDDRFIGWLDDITAFRNVT